MPFLKTPPTLGMPEVMKHNPDIAESFYLLNEAIMRGPSVFSPGERELIAAYVSVLNGCEYCRSSHTSVAEAFGISKGLVGNRSTISTRRTTPTACAPPSPTTAS